MVTMEEDPPVPSPAPPPPLPAEPTEVQEMEVDAGLMDGDRDSGAKAPPDAAAADDDVNDGNGDRPDGGADNSEAAPNPPTADPPADGEMVDANPPADDAPADGGMAAGVSPAEGEMANADTPAEDSDQGDQPPLTLATLSVPPGRLGVTLKMDPAGGARITKIDTSCPFRNKVKIGDRIISVDETTVKSIPDFLEGRDRDRELGVLTRRKKPGRPRGARATKRELRKSMEPACADPGRDTSGVHCSDEFLRYLKYKQKEPELVPAYRALKEAKERRDAAKKAVDERREEVAALNVALEAAKAGLEEGEAELEREEASFRAALDGVADVELKRECPWNESYRKLVAYREANGNIDLPARCREDPELDKLCLWVSRQKRQYRGYRYGEIKNERPWRITALEQLGIVWEVKGGLWEKSYNELIAYKEEHGHCIVPTRTSDRYKDLGSWVTVQREEGRKFSEGKKATIDQKRVELLNEIGFVWNVQNHQWRGMYDRLLAFRAQEGHADVPAAHPDDQALSNWVARQRKEYERYRDESVDHERDSLGRLRSTRMTEERIGLLNEIGFVW